jgi:ankyrin repeat protein
MAPKNGSLETARVLLEHEANVNYKDNHGKTALHLALHHPSFDLSRPLLVAMFKGTTYT